MEERTPKVSERHVRPQAHSADSLEIWQPIPILQPDAEGHLATSVERLFDGLLGIAMQCFGGNESSARARLLAVVKKIINTRHRVTCLRCVMSLLLAPRVRDMEAELEELAQSKSHRRQQVKRFFENYRPPQTSREVPVGQVTEDITKNSAALLETQCKFWHVADVAAGKSKTNLEPLSAQDSSKGQTPAKALHPKPDTWIVRGARERKPQRWTLAERFRQEVSDSASNQWDVRRTSSLIKPALPSALKNSKSSKVLKHVQLSGLGEKSVSAPSLHSRYGGCGKDPQSASAGSDAFSRNPVMAMTFKESWKAEAKDKQKKGSESAMTRYMTTCERGGILPSPLDFITGLSPRLNAVNWALADCDLIPVAAMFRTVPQVLEVDLSGNTLLTDKSVVPLLQKMMRNPACKTLSSLRLRQCIRLGHPSVELLVSLIASPQGLSTLKVLDMSGIHLPVKSQFELCKALGDHSNLENLMLADTGLGSNPAIKRCLDVLFGCSTLTALDLSWNSFGDEVFTSIGTNVAHPHVQLRSFSMSSCSSASDAEGASVMLESLSKARSLTYLDVSMNRLDLNAALVLADALSAHPCLKELDVSRNPFGAPGAHFLIRLFAVSKLEKLQCLEAFDMGDAFRQHFFQFCNPEGEYDLNMGLPHSRAVLRILLKLCKILGLSTKQAFTDLTLSEGCTPLTEAVDEHGTFEVPIAGRITFVFSTTKATGPDVYEESMESIAESLLLRNEQCKIRLRLDKAVLLIPVFDALQDKLPFIDALAKNFVVEYSHIEMLCKLGKTMMIPTIIQRLLHACASGSVGRQLCLRLASTQAQYRQILRRAMLSMTFTPSNPSMHYTLFLEEPCDFHVAERVRILDRWEASAAIRRGFFDTSQRGNQSQVRNERYEGRRPLFRSIMDWELPLSGKLEFDFAGGPRTAAGTVEMAGPIFEEFFQHLLAAKCRPSQQFEALRAVSPYIYLASSQLRRLLGVIYDAEVRMHAFHVFYFRLTDIWNVKVCRARFSSDECLLLMKKLGPVKFFPYIQPEQAQLDLDFSVHDEKLAVNLLVMLQQKEGALLLEPRYIREDGTEDKLVTGVPRAWARFSDLPRAGTFAAKYFVTPEKRNMKTRIDFLAAYGRWRTPSLKQEDVSWWSTLSDVSLDIIRFLEVMREKYRDNLKEAFRDIDGGGGNGLITLKEFEEYCDRLEDSRFRGNNRRERFRAIFRYLDATLEGSISVEEWLQLDTVKRELDRQTGELHDFFIWRYGEIAKAWAVLEKSGDGEMSQEEWSNGLKELGYFGASVELYSVLDTTNDGTINFEEFTCIARHAQGVA